MITEVWITEVWITEVRITDFLLMLLHKDVQNCVLLLLFSVSALCTAVSN